MPAPRASPSSSCTACSIATRTAGGISSPRETASTCFAVLSFLIGSARARSSGGRPPRRPVGGYSTGRMRHFVFPHDSGRDLCGFLAVCRYLTREQIERLMFPGRSKARSSTRLRQLASRMGGQAAVLRGDLGFGSLDGWTTVWALTSEGFEIGAQRLGLKLERVPKHDVGQAFLKHEVMVNEVFLGLVPQDGKTPAKVPRHVRWVLGEYLNLPFEEFDRDAMRLEQRRLQPDAMLEDPTHHRRYFIEYETGTATINDAKKSTSTRANLDRYYAFFKGNYRVHFNDRWRPRLLFVTQSEARRNSIVELLEKEDFPTTGEFAARALTLEGAKQFLIRKLSSSASSPAREVPMPQRPAADRNR